MNGRNPLRSNVASIAPLGLLARGATSYVAWHHVHGSEERRNGGSLEGPIRDEVLMGLVYRARTDLEFKRSFRSAVDRVLLDEYRYDLNEEELEACRAFWCETIGMTEERLDRRLAKLADPIEPTRGIQGKRSRSDQSRAVDEKQTLSKQQESFQRFWPADHEIARGDSRSRPHVRTGREGLRLSR